MRYRSAFLLVPILVSSTTAGCTPTTYLFDPKTLVKLDGFRGDGGVRLESYSKDTIVFNKNTELIWRNAGKPEMKSQFQWIEVEGPAFTGIQTDKKQVVHIDLEHLDYVKILKVAKQDKAAAGILVGLIVGGGALLLLSQANFSIGYARPLRVPGHSTPMCAPLVTNRRTITRKPCMHLKDDVRAALFSYWAGETSAESASVPAFLALARDLTRASAPKAMIQAAEQSATDEAKHARLCARLANELTDSPIAAIAPPVPDHHDKSEMDLLERLAQEALWDGCLAEGAASTLAQRTANHTKDKPTRSTLQTIARDERSHAELARQTIAFCVARGGKRIRNALCQRFEEQHAAEEARIRMAPADDVQSDQELLQQFGLPSPRIIQSTRIEMWEKNLSFIQSI